MARPCPPTLALPSAFVSGVKWAGKIPNISLESSSQTAGTITEKAAAPGTEAFSPADAFYFLGVSVKSRGSSGAPVPDEPLNPRLPSLRLLSGQHNTAAPGVLDVHGLVC